MHQVLTVNLLSQSKVFMSPRIKFCLLWSLACFVTAFSVSAQRQLQDSFFLERTWSNGFTLANGGALPGYGITIDFSNRCFVANGNSVFVYDKLGNLLTNWAVPLARDVSFDPASNVVYVCSATGSAQVRVYDMNYNLLRQWGTNSLSNPYGIAVGTNGLVYIADTGNNQIQVFDASGNFVRKWGEAGSHTGLFNGIYHIATGSDGSVWVADYWNNRIQSFDANGNFLDVINTSTTMKSIAIANDGLIFADDNRYNNGWMYWPQSGFLYTLNSATIYYDEGAAFSPDGQRLYQFHEAQINVYHRAYRVAAGVKPPNALALPIVMNISQRGGTQWIDIDFSVVDSDNATVQVGAVGFVDGRKDLLAAVPMKTFTNGTDIVSWTNVTTGVKHHLTWDALTDWFALYGNIKVNILAKDNRNLLDFHLITIPSNTTYATPLNISVSPYGHADFLGVWTWLIATRDPNVNLATGSVYAVGNQYGVTNNTLLAYTQIASGQTNTLTTSDGRTFLYSIISSNMVSTVYSNLVVREATSNEVYRAAMGTTHTNLTTITKWTPLVQINGLPVSVNEYGFDTGSITAGGGLPNNAWWVVLAPPGQ